MADDDPTGNSESPGAPRTQLSSPPPPVVAASPAAGVPTPGSEIEVPSVVRAPRTDEVDGIVESELELDEQARKPRKESNSRVPRNPKEVLVIDPKTRGAPPRADLPENESPETVEATHTADPEITEPFEGSSAAEQDTAAPGDEATTPAPPLRADKVSKLIEEHERCLRSETKKQFADLNARLQKTFADLDATDKWRGARKWQLPCEMFLITRQCRCTFLSNS